MTEFITKITVKCPNCGEDSGINVTEKVQYASLLGTFTQIQGVRCTVCEHPFTVDIAAGSHVLLHQLLFSDSLL